MARAPLPLETWGKIRRTVTLAGTPAAVAYYRDLDGKRRRLLRVGKSPAKAEEALKEALRDRLSPASEYITPSSPLSALAKAWVADLDKTKKAAGTKRRYKSVVNSHVNAHVGAIRIQEATVPRLQRIIDLVEESSGASQAKILGIVLTGMMGLAVRNGAIRDNPGKNLRMPIIELKAVRAPDMETIAELYRRLAAYDAVAPVRSGSIRDLTDFADVMLATGGRIGEVLALQWPDVNWETWTVTIDATLVSIPGEGLVRGPLKSAASRRTLHIPEFVRPMLSKRYKSAVVAWVFPSANGGPRWPENVRQQWRTALLGSDAVWMTPHDLRKAVATALGTEAAMRQLGHASTSVADRHYVEKTLLRPDQSEVLARFGSFRTQLKVANK